MAEKSREVRYMPALTGLLLLTLAGAAWLLYDLRIQPVVQSSASQIGSLTAAAGFQARRAFDGNDTAWDELNRVRGGLQSVQTTEFSQNEKRNLAGARTSVGVLLDGRGDVEVLQRTITRISSSHAVSFPSNARRA